jgi:ketosteroid isomerase-like protein
MSDHDIAAIKAAADHITDRFGAFDHDGYFACFAPEATFMFHTTDRLLGSCAEYQAEWAAWIESGFSVLSCASLDQRIDLVSDDIAVFTHRVLTTIRDTEGDHDLVERESIIFRRESNGNWLGVHEHLSPAPNA